MSTAQSPSRRSLWIAKLSKHGADGVEAEEGAGFSGQTFPFTALFRRLREAPGCSLTNNLAKPGLTRVWRHNGGRCIGAFSAEAVAGEAKKACQISN